MVSFGEYLKKLRQFMKFSNNVRVVDVGLLPLLLDEHVVRRGNGHANGILLQTVSSISGRYHLRNFF